MNILSESAKLLSDSAFEEVVQALPSVHLKGKLAIHNVVLMHRIRELEEEVRQLGGTSSTKNGRPLMTKSTNDNAASTKDPRIAEMEREIIRLKSQLTEKPKETIVEKIVDRPVEIIKEVIVHSANPSTESAELKELRQTLKSMEKDKEAKAKTHQENLTTVRRLCAQVVNMRKKMEQAGLPVPPLPTTFSEVETAHETIVERIVEVPVERVVTVDKIVEVEKIVEVPVERIVTVERIVHVEKQAEMPNEMAVRDSERNKIVAWLNKMNIGETVRALYGQKMAKLIAKSEYRSK